MNGEIIGKLWMEDHGLGRGILIEKGKTWSKVRTGHDYLFIKKSDAIVKY